MAKWIVTRASGPGSEAVEAENVTVTDSGALVFTGPLFSVIKAFAAGRWLEVERVTDGG